MSILFILLAGIGRVLVGMGRTPRWYTYPPLAMICAGWSLGPTAEAAIVALLSALTVGLGWTKWENRLWQSIRYSTLPLVAAVTALIAQEWTLSVSLLLWALSCAAVGAIEIDIRVRLERFGFRVFGRDVSSAQFAEFIIGAVCIGGAALL